MIKAKNQLSDNYKIVEGTRVIADSAFSDFSSLTSIEIPNSVTSIGSSAFENCSTLKTVEIGKSVAFIGTKGFYNCPSINRIRSYNPEPPTCDGIVFGDEKYDCSLYVPGQGLSGYKTTEPWSRFKEIIPMNWELVDKMPYTNDFQYDNFDFTYNRDFEKREWQPLFVPFSMSYEEWCDKADIARIDAVRQYDGNDDGDYDDVGIDETVIEFTVLKKGEIRPNMPYLIRPKQTGEMIFEFNDKTLYSSYNQQRVELSTYENKYSFYGVYESKELSSGSRHYEMRDGEFHLCKAPTTIPPYRFYLFVVNSYGSATYPETIKIKVNGDNATEIYETTITPSGDVYYDLMGNRVNNPSKGIYIRNGKKVVLK